MSELPPADPQHPVEIISYISRRQLELHCTEMGEVLEYKHNGTRYQFHSLDNIYKVQTIDGPHILELEFDPSDPEHLSNGTVIDIVSGNIDLVKNQNFRAFAKFMLQVILD